MNAGDLETAFAGLAPDIECHHGEWVFDAEVLYGREALIDYYRRQRDTARWEVEAHEVEEVDPGTILVRQSRRAIFRATGIVTERESFFIYELGPTGVKCIREFATREEALAAVGG
jgi:hypothetical protein